MFKLILRTEVKQYAFNVNIILANDVRIWKFFATLYLDEISEHPLSLDQLSRCGSCRSNTSKFSSALQTCKK